MVGYSLYVKNGQCTFSVRRANEELHQVQVGIGNGRSDIRAAMDTKGVISLQVNKGEAATAKSGLLPKHPSESICIGLDDRNPVDAAAPKPRFNGKLIKLDMK